MTISGCCALCRRTGWASTSATSEMSARPWRPGCWSAWRLSSRTSTCSRTIRQWVALGGDAYHLTEVARRLQALSNLAGQGDVEAPGLWAGSRACCRTPTGCSRPGGGEEVAGMPTN